jgi:hypothetical protein
MNHDLRHYTSFLLASRDQKYCGFENLRFYHEDGRYVLRGTECAETFHWNPLTGGPRKFCGCCASLSRCVAEIVRESNKKLEINSNTRLTEKQRASLPSPACELVDAVRKKKRQNDRNNVRRISRLTELLEKESQVAEMEDVGTFVKILAKAKPHVKETMEAEVFEQSLLMLQTKAGNPKAKPMYHEAVIKYALSLLGQVNKKTYESLAQILALHFASTCSKAEEEARRCGRSCR